MKSLKIIWILFICVIGFSAYSCKIEEIILHGEIDGFVSDVETGLPIGSASIRLNPSNDSTQTGLDGLYHFTNLIPGEFEIEASKHGYGTTKENVTVFPAKTKTIDISLNGVPSPVVSADYIDYGLESTSQYFTISNIGRGRFFYLLITDKDWITVNPSSGVVTDEIDSIRVTIDRTDISKRNVYKEKIKLISDFGSDSVSLFLNGIMDNRDLKYYRIIKIGTQVWMAENLNAGTFISRTDIGPDNGRIEKYCYNNEETNCSIYGGLYLWDEVMQYHSPDTNMTGTTQGACPDGWHVPTKNEWQILVDNLGGSLIAGGKFKETGTAHWFTPNIATNETGFSVLPAGGININFYSLGEAALLKVSSSYDDVSFINGSGAVTVPFDRFDIGFKTNGGSVRCIKDSYMK